MNPLLLGVTGGGGVGQKHIEVKSKKGSSLGDGPQSKRISRK